MNAAWAKYLNEQTDRCWFCGDSGCDEFDTEFDTFIHIDCLKKELKKHESDESYETEAVYMKYLLDGRED